MDIMSIAVAKSMVNNTVEEIKEKFGAPLVSSTSAGMTDQSRVYVYTGNESGFLSGHWYYYNGSMWTDGGVYNAVAVETDTTLSVSGKAADGKAVGDQLSDVMSDLNELSESASRGVDTDATGTDLDIVDSSGYVLARFSDGHIQTKNFDSSVEKVNVNQGSGNAGKYLVVGSNGNVELKSINIPTGSVSMANTNALADMDIIDYNGNVIMRLDDGHIQTKEFDSSSAYVGFEYKFSGFDLLIGYGYNSTSDAVVVLNCGRANDLFDFSNLKLKPKGTPLKNLNTADLTNVWTSGTDMHGPFEFLAVNNIDGYYSEVTDPGWTGGVHTCTINGNTVKTAATKYLHFFADGKPVSSGYGRCTHFEIRWANDVQAYNTVKADGTGRSCLTEYHDMIFDGVKFSEQVRIMPKEDIKMQLWYGFQGVAFHNVYTNIAFIDGENRLLSSTDSARTSGNAVTSGIKGIGTNHEVEILMDTNIDLGKRPYYSGTDGAFNVVSTGKVYFNTIRKMTSNQVVFAANSNYYLNGSYRFFSAVQ